MTKVEAVPLLLGVLEKQHVHMCERSYGVAKSLQKESI